MIELTNLWAGIIGLAIFLYVLLDGFDLGVGVLFYWMHTPQERSIMLSSIIPIWDGKQTWLVFGGATLYGAFPAAFSAILPSIYIPMILMLIFLLLRGISLEFRLKSTTLTPLWDKLFCSASFFTALCQGMILGTYVIGFGKVAPSYQNVSHLQWLTPFSLLSGIGIVAGYTHLGCCWLILKTEGAIQTKAFKLARQSLLYTATILLIFCIWTPLLSEIHATRWFESQAFPVLIALPLCSIVSVLFGLYALWKRYETMPFLAAIGLFICAAMGVIHSIYPYIVPHAMTLEEAGASKASLQFMLYGAAVMMPFLFIYTMHAHYVFRGKVRSIIHY